MNRNIFSLVCFIGTVAVLLLATTEVVTATDTTTTPSNINGDNRASLRRKHTVSSVGGKGEVTTAAIMSSASLLSSLSSKNKRKHKNNKNRKLLLSEKSMMILGKSGDNGSPEEAFPLGFCEGDCDTDDDCEGSSLVCFQHDGNTKNIPGCNAGSKSRTDYCVNVNYDLLPFDDTTTVKNEITFGSYVGIEKYIWEGEISPYCSQMITLGEDQNKLMVWMSNTGSCTDDNIVNPWTGEVTGDWFGNINLQELYIEKILSTQCVPSSECDPDLIHKIDEGYDDPIMSTNYNVKAVSCGRMHKDDLPRDDTLYCDFWQTALLERKVDSSGDNMNLPEQMVVLTLTYGDTFSDIENPNCPNTVTYNKMDIINDSFAVGSAQFILQGNLTALGATDLCNWDCLENKDELYGCSDSSN